MRQRMINGGVTKRTRGIHATPRISVFLDAWLNSYAPHQLGDETRRKYRRDIEHHIIAHLDDPLDSITRAQLNTLFNETLMTHATESARWNAFKTLRTMLNYAVAEDVIVKSPLTGMKTPSRKTAVQHDDEDLIDKRVKMSKDIIRWIADNNNPHHEHYARVLLMFVGMRRGEILGLEWNRIKQLEKKDHANLIVSQTLHRYENGDGWHILRESNRGRDNAGTKTGNRRRVYLPNRWRLALLEERRKQRTAKEEWANELVFLREDGRHIDFNDHYDAWDRILYDFVNRNRDIARPLRADERWRPHANRQISAAILFDEGIPIELVQETLGHNDRAMTLYYTKLMKSAKRDAMKRYDHAFED